MTKGPFCFYDEKAIKSLLDRAGFKKISIEIVSKTGKIQNVKNIVQGFIKGTPLASYLHEKSKAIQQELTDQLTQVLTQHYGSSDLNVPMQALVVQAEK